jgi:UDP-N-acetylmuramoyl-tripeptide--D-alanyl-D-alanine ligase
MMNTFAKEALRKVLRTSLLTMKLIIDDRTILVADSLTLLQELALYHRKYLKTPIIAFDSSNGKQLPKG